MIFIIKFTGLDRCKMTKFRNYKLRISNRDRSLFANFIHYGYESIRASLPFLGPGITFASFLSLEWGHLAFTFAIRVCDYAHPRATGKATVGRNCLHRKLLSQPASPALRRLLTGRSLTRIRKKWRSLRKNVRKGAR